MKKTTLCAVSALTALMLVAGTAQARICFVNDFDTQGCQKGDDLLYMPERWGNEQLPIEFAAKKCDFSKSVLWNNGGVACVYAGGKDFVVGKDEVTRKSYAAVFNKAVNNPRGWYRTDRGEYWKVVQKGNGGPMKEGDTVVLAYQKCEHDIDGRESRGNYAPDGQIDSLTKSHWVYEAQPEPVYGSIIEIVGPYRHGFLKVEKKAKPKAKNKK